MLEEQKAEMQSEFEQILKELENAVAQDQAKQELIQNMEKDSEQRKDDYRRLTDSFYRLKKEKEDGDAEQSEYIKSLESKLKNLSSNSNTQFLSQT